MRRWPLLQLLAGAVLLAGTQPALAHHSFSATYDLERQIEIQGTIKELVWRNPHSFLRIDVTDASGNTETWTLEWGSINQLADADLTRTTLRPGDVVVATGLLPRDSSNPRLLLWNLTRPSDGWAWVGRVLDP